MIGMRTILEGWPYNYSGAGAGCPAFWHALAADPRLRPPAWATWITAPAVKESARLEPN